MLVDSHCHLNRLGVTLDDAGVGEVLRRARAAGLQHLLTVGTAVECSREAIVLAQTYDDVSCSVGVHPSDIDDQKLDLDVLVALARESVVVAIGETGLDYHYNDTGLECMRQAFRDHVTVAKAVKKPLIIHTRAASADTAKILSEESADEVGGVMHCFTESWSLAKTALDLGFYISISGIVTFKNADNIREVAKKVPLDRLLIETDSPYLAPVPYRGKVNEPAFVREVAIYLADYLSIDYDKFVEMTGNNFMTCFRL